MTQMHTLIVGSKSPIEFNNQEQQAYMDAFHNTPFINIFWVAPNITRNEARDFKKGKAKIGFYQGKYIFSFVWELGKQIFETPFDVNRIPLEKLVIPDIKDDEFLLIKFFVIDSATNTVKAIRGFTLSQSQTKRFMNIIHKQLANPEIVDPQTALFYEISHLSKSVEEIAQNANMEKVPSTY